VRRVASFGSSRVIPVSPNTDPDLLTGSGTVTPWTTDQWLFGWKAGRPIALELPLDCGLKNITPTPRWACGWPRLPLGVEREPPECRFDAGGNFLVAPGPEPRIITSTQIQPTIRNSLKEMLGGSNYQFVDIDTSWLKVGHVDEIVSFVPDGTTGFRLVLPDYLAGLRLLQSIPGDRVLFGGTSGRYITGTVTASGPRCVETDADGIDTGKWKYLRIISGPQAGLIGRVCKSAGRRLIIDLSWDQRGESPTQALETMRNWQCETMPRWIEPPEPGSRIVIVEDTRFWLDGRGSEVPAFITAGELCRDRALKDVARKCALRVDGAGGVRDTVLRALDLPSEALLRLPVLARGDKEAQDVTALLPNPVNLVCIDNDVVLLQPHGPRIEPGDESSDVFAQAWRAALDKCGLNPVFLEGWNSLHRLDGGAHCGINVLRRPVVPR
jgi:hypothetical protein